MKSVPAAPEPAYSVPVPVEPTFHCTLTVCTPALKPVAIDGKSYTDRGYLLAQAR